MLHVTPTPYLRDLGTTLVIVDEVHNLPTDNPAGAQAASALKVLSEPRRHLSCYTERRPWRTRSILLRL